MLNVLRQRLAKDDEDGFTLIELMVVVLIIAILIAIAIPTFLGARSRAQDRAAQSDLRNTLAAEKTYYTEEEAYTATNGDITAIEPNLTMAADPDDGVVLSQPVGDDQVVCMTRTSAAGNTFALHESAQDGTRYGETDLSATCPATAPNGYVSTGW